MKIANPEYSVDTIVRRMREASKQSTSNVLPAQISQASGDATGELESDQDHSRDKFDPQLDVHDITLQPPFIPNADDSYHVNDLLKFSDEQFVRNAYLAILKRPAEPTGLQGLLAALRSGQLNKIDVLAQLRFSTEGKEKSVRIDGLRLTALTRKLYRVPGLGYWLNVAIAVARLPSLIRNQRALENHLVAQQDLLVNQINHIGRALSASAQQTADVISSRSGMIRDLEQQLGDHHRQLGDHRQQLSDDRQQLGNHLQQLELLRTEHAAVHEVVLIRIGELTRYFEERLNEEAAVRETESGKMQQLLLETGGEWRDQLQQQAGLLRTDFDELVAAERVARGKAVVELGSILRNCTDEILTSLREEVDRVQGGLLNDLENTRLSQQQLTSELALQGLRLTRFMESAVRSSSNSEQLQVVPEDAHLLDAFYASFEEAFRGNRENIKERLRVYLPFVTSRDSQTDTVEVLDIGCGRGEWLELLQDQGIAAVGVDSNLVSTAQCRHRGLQVVEADLLEYLRQLPDESISVISGFHIVEHLPIEALVEFLNETMRVLKSGGLILLETPNPRNVLVGSCNFYFDPTHRNPLPSEVLRFLVQSRGFGGIEILLLNPSDEQPVAGDSELVDRFNRYFYGPMDYGIAAWKPAARNKATDHFSSSSDSAS